MSAPALVRIPGWRSALSRHIALAAPKAPVWGTHDCALFPADGVLAMTGVDPAEAFRGHYTTPAGSLRALKRYGAGDLLSTFAQALRAVTGQPWPGDPCIITGDYGPTGAIWLATNIVTIGEPRGLVYCAHDRAIAVFEGGR